MKVFLDDERKTPEGWVRTYSVEETIKLLETGEVTHLSLDHDLGTGVRDGQHVTLWLKEKVFNDPSFKLPEHLYVHSMNPVGKQNMKADLRWCIEYIQKRKEEANGGADTTGQTTGDK